MNELCYNCIAGDCRRCIVFASEVNREHEMDIDYEDEEDND